MQKKNAFYLKMIVLITVLNHVSSLAAMVIAINNI